MTIPPASKQPCYPQRDGNTAIPYIDGERAFERIFNTILEATSKVWLTMCFVDIHFEIPSIHQCIIDILAEISQKNNIDVRVLAWRSNVKSGDFHGTESDFIKLKSLNCKAKFRWDTNELGCHHQKIFVIDDTIAFVGGINMDETHIDNSEHNRIKPHPTHDLFCEIRGPAVRDVTHNFVQRWNEATEKNEEDGSYPQDETPSDIAFPPEQPTQKSEGNVKIQVTRTIPKDTYSAISNGEYSIRESYLKAIDNAKKYVYLENQYFFDKVSHYSVIRALIYAAYRGVKIFVVLPGEPDFTRLFSFEFLKEVKNHPNIYVYTLATPYQANNTNRFKYNDIYVHSKLFIVDDEWYSIGSANISYESLRTDTEINVAVWDPIGAENLRHELWKEHLQYSDHHRIQYDQNIIVDGDIDETFEQWWFLARANRYYRKTESRSENRLMPLDINKYSKWRKFLGDIKDFFKKSWMKLSGKKGDLLEAIRKLT